MRFAWASMSTHSTRRPCSARAPARLMAVVVLPTPPFWFAIAMTLATVVITSLGVRVLVATDRLCVVLPRGVGPEATSGERIVRFSVMLPHEPQPAVLRLSTELRSCSPILWISSPQSPLPEWAVRAGYVQRGPALSLSGNVGPSLRKDGPRRGSLAGSCPDPCVGPSGLAPTNSRHPSRPDWHVWASPCHHPVVGSRAMGARSQREEAVRGGRPGTKRRWSRERAGGRSGTGALARDDPGEGRFKVARAPGAVPDDLRRRDPGPLHAGRPRRPRRGPRPGPSRRVPVHPGRPADDVPRPPLDDAPVRRILHGRGHQPPLPVPPRAGPDGALGRLRPADPDGLRLRRAPGRGRGRAGSACRSAPWPTWRSCSTACRSEPSARR